jgi:hypothetical protein
MRFYDAFGHSWPLIRIEEIRFALGLSAEWPPCAQA